MSSQEELQVWQDRWESLDGCIGELIENLSDDTFPIMADFPRKETIYNLLQKLKAFGQSHFAYFYQGFLSGKPDLSNGVDQFPPAFILRSIVDQIAYDMDVLFRAINQRLPYGSTDNIRDSLDKADLLAMLALQPADEIGLIEKGTTVLTYFQKSPSVRVIPYAKAAIIGIPFTALDVRRDYLAIPHEVAHYIFRHGKHNDKPILTSLTNKYKSKDKYIRNWIEEVFADVYGSLIAGPLIAIDFQDLQLDDPLKEFATASIDFEDPVPIVRPDIYSKVLAFADKPDWSRMAGLLNDRWKDYRNEYWANYKEHHLNQGNANGASPESAEHPITFTTSNQTIKVDDVREDGLVLTKGKPLDDVISDILGDGGVLSGVVAQIKRGYVEWSENTSGINEANLEVLYDNFSLFLSEKLQKANTLVEQDITSESGPVVYIPDLPDAPQSLLDPDQIMADAGISLSSLWVKYVEDWAKYNGYAEINASNRVMELLETPGNSRPPKTDRRPATPVWGWSELASANGWTTRGPEPNPIGGFN